MLRVNPANGRAERTPEAGSTTEEGRMNPERRRLEEAPIRRVACRKWGPSHAFEVAFS